MDDGLLGGDGACDAAVCAAGRCRALHQETQPDDLEEEMGEEVVAAGEESVAVCVWVEEKVVVAG